MEGQPSAQLLEEDGGTAHLDYELKKTQIAFLFFLMLRQFSRKITRKGEASSRKH